MQLSDWLDLSVSFEYLYYVSMAIRNILIPSVQGPYIHVKIWRLQTSDSDLKDGSRAERVRDELEQFQFSDK